MTKDYNVMIWKLCRNLIFIYIVYPHPQASSPEPEFVKICKGPRNRFLARRADTTTLLDVPARQATWAGEIINN